MAPIEKFSQNIFNFVHLLLYTFEQFHIPILSQQGYILNNLQTILPVCLVVGFIFCFVGGLFFNRLLGVSTFIICLTFCMNTYLNLRATSATITEYMILIPAILGLFLGFIATFWRDAADRLNLMYWCMVIAPSLLFSNYPSKSSFIAGLIIGSIAILNPFYGLFVMIIDIFYVFASIVIGIILVATAIFSWIYDFIAPQYQWFESWGGLITWPATFFVILLFLVSIKFQYGLLYRKNFKVFRFPVRFARPGRFLGLFWRKITDNFARWRNMGISGFAKGLLSLFLISIPILSFYTILYCDEITFNYYSGCSQTTRPDGVITCSICTFVFPFRLYQETILPEVHTYTDRPEAALVVDLLPNSRRIAGSGGGARLYAAPDAVSQRSMLDWFPNGTPVYLIGAEQNGWRHVAILFWTGYIQADDIQLGN